MKFFRITMPLAADYLVRLSQDQLDALALTHLHSGIDSEAPADAGCAASGGYTEWVALHAERTVSLGWDWETDAARCLRRKPGQPIRTNIMLQDPRGVDLGRNLTLARLIRLIARLNWQEEILRHLEERNARFH